MFGSFIGTTNDAGTDWGEQMLNTVASQSIRHLFSQSESIDLEIHCHPSSKLLQGNLDGIKMTGTGLVIRRDFPVERMSFETDMVAIDFGSILSGTLRLKQPTQAMARVELSESGINRAFGAKLVTRRLENLDWPQLMEISGGKPVSFGDVQVKLLPQNRIEIFAKAQVGDESIPICANTQITIERRRRVLFEDAQFKDENVPEPLQDKSRSLGKAFIAALNEMVDLDRFDLDGVMMRLNRLETQGKNLIFSGYARIDRVPKNP